MPSIADTLTHKVGPAPVWVWAGAGVAVIVGYEYYRRKQQQSQQDNTTTNALSSNTGQPISNLTQAAQPMPFQMGDTFVQTTVNNPPVNSGSPTVQPGAPMQPVTPAKTTTPASTTKPAGSYYALSPAAATNAVTNLHYTLYQTGAEAIAWAKAHGQPAPNVNPKGYYALSPAAALEAIKEKITLYQTGAEANQYAATH